MGTLSHEGEKADRREKIRRFFFFSDSACSIYEGKPMKGKGVGASGKKETGDRRRG